MLVALKTSEPPPVFVSVPFPPSLQPASVRSVPDTSVTSTSPTVSPAMSFDAMPPTENASVSLDVAAVGATPSCQLPGVEKRPSPAPPVHEYVVPERTAPAALGLKKASSLALLLRRTSLDCQTPDELVDTPCQQV